MNAMTAADHGRHFEPASLCHDCVAQLFEIVENDSRGLHQLNGQGGIQNVGRSESLMDPTRGRPDRGRHIFEKCYDIVIRPLLDFQNLRHRETRALANLSSVLLGNLSQFGHGLTGQGLNFEPDLEFALVRPDSAHLRARITINHLRRRYEPLRNAKGLLRPKKIAPGDRPPGATSESRLKFYLSKPLRGGIGRYFQREHGRYREDPPRWRRFLWYS